MEGTKIPKNLTPWFMNDPLRLTYLTCPAFLDIYDPPTPRSSCQKGEGELQNRTKNVQNRDSKSKRDKKYK